MAGAAWKPWQIMAASGVRGRSQPAARGHRTSSDGHLAGDHAGRQRRSSPGRQGEAVLRKLTGGTWYGDIMEMAE